MDDINFEEDILTLFQIQIDDFKLLSESLKNSFIIDTLPIETSLQIIKDETKLNEYELIVSESNTDIPDEEELIILDFDSNLENLPFINLEEIQSRITDDLPIKSSQVQKIFFFLL